MSKDLAVIMDDHPGRLADLGEALGRAGVNIEGVTGAPAGGGALLHILVDDSAAARRALDAARFRIHEEREMLMIKPPDRPGELGGLCRKLADAGVNIDLVYPATGSRLALSVDNLEKARAALSAWE